MSVVCLSNHVQKLYAQTVDRQRSENRQDARQRFTSSLHGATALKYVRNSFPPSPTALRNDDGHIITSPDSLDQLMRNKWDAVYQGSVSNHEDTITNCFHKYARFIFRSAEAHVNDITADDLFDSVADAGRTSQGMDHWVFSELSLLAFPAFHYLAILLGLIDAGNHGLQDFFSRERIYSAKIPRSPWTRWSIALS